MCPDTTDHMLRCLNELMNGESNKANKLVHNETLYCFFNL